MARAGADALRTLLAELRQLRDIKGMQEASPGGFTLRREAFVDIDDDSGVLSARLKKAGGSGFDRYPLGTAAERRRFADDAKLRARRLDDE